PNTRNSLSSAGRLGYRAASWRASLFVSRSVPVAGLCRQAPAGRRHSSHAPKGRVQSPQPTPPSPEKNRRWARGRLFLARGRAPGGRGGLGTIILLVKED